MRLNLERLPGISRLWLDFVRSRLPILSAAHNIEDLVSHTEAVRKSGRDEDLLPDAAAALGLGRRDSFAIVAEVGAGPFGGPLSGLLKCITAVRLCHELAKHSISAVPVVWIGDPGRDFSTQPVYLVDARGELRPVGIPSVEAAGDEISGMISEIAKSGDGVFDPEAVEIVKNAFTPGSSIQSGCAHLFSALLREWGAAVLDPGAPELRPVIDEARSRVFSKDAGLANELLSSAIPVAGAVFPVLACVADPLDISPVAASLAFFEKLHIARPAVWPCASATIGDVRSRKTLSRYRLDPVQLYSGADEVMRAVGNSLPRSAPEKLDRLIAEVEVRVGQLRTDAAPDKELIAAAGACGDKILYQLERLRDRSRAALNLKAETAGRRIRAACNWLAPNGNLQERELACVQVPLSFSQTGLRKLRDGLDILNFEHQLIWMD